LNDAIDFFVLRKDLLANPTGRSVTEEFALLNSMAGFCKEPVPLPLWMEADSKFFGTAVLAMPFFRGSNDFGKIVPGSATSSDFIRHLAHSIAHIHSVPLTSVVDVENAPASVFVAQEVARWRRLFFAWQTEPHPILEAVLSWLEAHIPDTGNSASVIHGDIGFHNMLLADGKITALLDWEYAHEGDPAEDLIYLRPFIEKIASWDEFIVHYQAINAVALSAESERFYSIWQSARNAVSCLGAKYVFISNPAAEAKLAVAGLTFFPRFELEALAKVAGVESHVVVT
jgi:aminoglycoside phosphotransferase (APT) family kinase protein